MGGLVISCGLNALVCFGGVLIKCDEYLNDGKEKKRGSNKSSFLKSDAGCKERRSGIIGTVPVMSAMGQFSLSRSVKSPTMDAEKN
ncbi:MAG: hypothetical protein ACREDS_03210 [Limisphaerales bacterium]